MSMTGQQIEEMLETRRISGQKLMVESIRTQMKLIDAICHRHRLWMNDAKDTETARLHVDIVNSLQQAKQNYAQLLEIHEKLIE